MRFLFGAIWLECCVYIKVEDFVIHIVCLFFWAYISFLESREFVLLFVSVVFFSDDFSWRVVTLGAVGWFSVFDFINDGDCAAVEVANVNFVHTCLEVVYEFKYYHVVVSDIF